MSAPITIRLMWTDHAGGADLLVASTLTALARVAWVRHGDVRTWYASTFHPHAPIVNGAESFADAKAAVERYFGVEP